MKLSVAAELAIRGTVALAARHGREPVTLDTICSDGELPKQYLTKIFASLVRDGLIVPVRGKRGGYLLARPPERITLLDIVQAVEGPLAVNRCQGSPPKCNKTRCPIRGLWSDLQATIARKLSGTTLRDCTRK